jgi:hypothetical protein
MNIANFQKLTSIAEGLDGVFTLSDFRILYPEDSSATRFRKLEELIEAGELVRVKRGIYARPNADLRRVSQRIAPESYLSLGTVLADEGLIGSIPGRRVWAVVNGRPRRYLCPLGAVEHVSLAPGLQFGWKVKDGLRMAVPEKAWLDALYLSYKGRKLSFDPVEDVDWSRLDRAAWSKYLTAYEPRFQNQMLQEVELV